MTRPLGKNQLERLLGLASPSSLLIVGSDAVSQSLVRRGLLRSQKPGDDKSWLQITPAGLRALADAHESGTLEQFFKWPPGLTNPRPSSPADQHLILRKGERAAAVPEV